MKRIFVSLVIAAAALVALVSCGGKSASVKAIPADSFFALKINVGEIIDQTGAKGNQDLIALATAEANPDEARFVKALINDPESSGIKLDEEIVLAGCPDGLIFMIPMKDADMFARFLGSLDAEVYPAKGEILYYIGDDDPDGVDGIILKDLAVIQGDRELRAGELFALVTKGGEIKDKAFDKFASTSDAMAFWFSCKGISNLVGSKGYGASAHGRSIIDSDVLEALSLLGNTSFVATADPGKGGIDFFSKLYLDEDALKRYGVDLDFDDIFTKGSDKYFKYMPANPTVVLNGATEDFEDILEALPAMVQYEVNSALPELGLTSKDLEKIGGNLTAALAINAPVIRDGYYGRNMEAKPSFAVAFQLDESIFNRFIPMLGLERAGGAWRLDDGDFPICIFYADGAVILMSEDLWKVSGGKKLSNSLADSPVRKNVPRAGVFFNFKDPNLTEYIKYVLEEENTPKALRAELLSDWALLDYSSCEADFSDESVVGTIRSTRSSEYFLKTLFDALLRIAKFS